MKTKNLFSVAGLLLGLAVLFLQACNNDDEPAGKGQAEFKMTDAPSDDPNIKGVFVTVADVKVDGKSIENFNKQSIDLKAYQNGRTELLGTSELAAKSYNNLTLVLDLETDANGNSPGCYVLDADNQKHQLKSTADGTATITMNKGWQVYNDAKSSIVMDFDLRKSIRYDEGSSQPYSFVSDNELNAAVRVVNEAKTGTVKGQYEDKNSNADKIVVYAYKKGTFNADTETTAQGEGQLLFANAVSSSELKTSLSGAQNFTLAFLEEGEYELHYAAYNYNTTSGRMEFQTELNSETTVNGSVGNIITVQSGVTLSLSAIVGIF